MATPPTFSVGSVLTANQMNQVGLWKVTSTTFTAQSSVSVNNCFTSDYTNYRIIMTLNGSSAGSFAHFRLRAGGTDLTSGSYYRYGTSNSFGGGIANYNAGGQTSHLVVGQWGSSLVSTCLMDICDPQTSNRTSWYNNVNDTGAGASYILNGLVDVSTSYDGFTVYPNSGTMTGTITVYGYRK